METEEPRRSQEEGAAPRRRSKMAPRKDAVSKKTIAKIEKLAESVLKTVEGGKNPFLDIPVRSLANVSWSEKRRLVELGRPEAEALLLQRLDGEEVHADVPGQRGLQGAHRRRQDDQHPRPLLHDQAHHRRHEAEHLRGSGRVRPDHRGPRGDGGRAARGAAPLRRAQGLDGGPDHDRGQRRHHRPAAHGLGRLVRALDRRGERHHLPQARGEVRAADREGRASGRASTRTSSGSATTASSCRAEASRRAACAAWCSGCTAS